MPFTSVSELANCHGQQNDFLYVRLDDLLVISLENRTYHLLPFLLRTTPDTSVYVHRKSRFSTFFPNSRSRGP